MATGNRTLKLSILADVDDLKKKLGEADKAVEKNSSKISEFGKKAAAAFAVAAAAAVAYGTKLAVDGVKAAIEDEQAQLRLANALRQATGATDAQIKATEDMILKTSLATGVADDQLRPAMQRLAVSTKSTEEAQKLLTLALDISAASGKDLETVANALGKAQDGNQAALGRLGLGLSKAELATLSFTEVQEKLADLYGGAAATNAETFQGKIDRLKVGFDEAKESLGIALLPLVEKFITFLNKTGIPIINGLIAGLTGDKGLSSALDETGKSAESVGRVIAKIAGIISNLITIVREAIGLVVKLINEFTRLLNLIPGLNIGQIPDPSPSGGFNRMSSMTNGGYQTGANTTNIVIQGAIDPVSTARQVSQLLNNEANTSGTIQNLGFSRYADRLV